MYAKSKNLASEMLPKSFKAVKCKTSLKLAVSRIKLLKNKREAQVRQMRRDLAQLLETGQEQTARIRVEHVIREEKTMSAYDLIELYCELIVARLPIIESQKTCPIDLKEAIATVIFASPRCADLPELMDVRKHLAAKYGKEFVTSALEIRPDCGVSRLVVEKLSARAPDAGIKMKTLVAIAKDHNVKWDPKAFEDELEKPKEDLLDGPKTFTSANKSSMEFSSFKASPASSQKHEPAKKMSENDLANNSASFETFSRSRATTPESSVPFAPQSGSRTSENRGNKPREAEAKYAHYREESSSNSQNWNMEFKDATSAAQAAAESAERASMAARAAVELASRGNASTDGRSEGPKETKGPGLKDERFEDSAKVDHHELKGSQGRKADITNSERDQGVEVSYMGAAKSKNDTSEQISRWSGRSASNSIETSVYDDLSDAEADGNYSASEPKEQNYDAKKNESAEFGHWNEKGSNSASFEQTSNAFDENVFWNSSTQKQEIHGEGISGSSPEAVYGQPATAVFDDSDSDREDYSVFANLLDSFSQHGGEEPTYSSSDMHLLSPKQRRSELVVEDSSSEMHSTTEPKPAPSSEFGTGGSVASPLNANVPLIFDDSDGLSSLSEDEPDHAMHKEAADPISSLQYQRSSTGGLLSAESPRNGSAPRNLNDRSQNGLNFSTTDEEMHPPQVLQATSSLEKAEPKAKSGVMSSHLDSQDSDSSDDFNRESEGGLSLGRLTGGFRQKGFPRPPYVRRPIADVSSLSNHSSVDSTDINEKPVLSYQDKTSGSFLVPDLESDNQEQHPTAQMSDLRMSNAYKDSSLEKTDRFKSRHTVGNRGYRGALDTLHSTAEENPDSVGKPILFNQGKRSANLETPVEELYSPRSQKLDYRESASNSRVPYFDPSSVEKNDHAVSDYRVNTLTTLNEGTESTNAVGKPSFARQTNTTRSSEIPSADMYDQKRPLNAYKESSLGKPVTDFEYDGNEADVVGPKRAVTGNNNKFSRRTRDLPTEGRRGSLSKFAGRSDTPDTSETVIKTSQEGLSSESISKASEQGTKGRQGSNPALSKSYVEQPSTFSQNKSSASKENSQAKPPNLDMAKLSASENSGSFKTSSSSPGAASSDSPLKRASHVHPKLPDYDTFAAHFRSLRSNRP